MNDSTFGRTSWTTLISLFTFLLAMSIYIVVCFGSPSPNFLYMDNVMRFILAPRSHNVSAKFNNPMVQELAKAPGSSFFFKRDLVVIALNGTNSHNPQ